MRIIFINPPSSSYRKPEEHLGFGYLASVARNFGAEAEIIDAYLLGISVKETIKKISVINDPDVIGFTFSMSSYDQFKEILKETKSLFPNALILCGGYMATFEYKNILKTLPIDFLVRGEGEETFREILTCLRDKKPINKIAGIAYLKNGEVIDSLPRPLIEDLDTITFPVRDTAKQAIKKKALIQLLGSRGCYGNCSFCSINALYKISPRPCSKTFGTWRGRSPISVVDELEEVVKKTGATNFKFIDDCFFSPGADWEERAWILVNEIKKRKLKVRFRISTRVNNVNEPLFRALKEVGLYSLSLGVESGNQNALNRFQKGVTVKQNVEAVRALDSLGIIIMMGFIGFDPYVTLEDLEENYNFLKDYCKNCVTNKVSLSLFAAEDTPITQKIIKDNLVVCKSGTNYEYRIKNEAARAVYDFLVAWNNKNEALYNKTIDPLSSPRSISKKNERIVHDLIRELRGYDLEAYAYALSLAKKKIQVPLGAVDNFAKKYEQKWTIIETKINQVYEEEKY